MSKIRILALPVDREPYITNIENSLKNMQRFVGGYIETVTVLKKPQVILICGLKGRALNPSIPDLDEYGGWVPEIVGNCFFCGVGRGKFADLPDAWKDVLLKLAKEAYRRHKEEQKWGKCSAGRRRNAASRI